MVKKYGDLKAPKKEEMMDEEMEMAMMSDLDLENMEDEDMSDMSPLADISDDELMAEMKSRGLMDDEMDEDMDPEEDMGDDEDLMA